MIYKYFNELPKQINFLKTNSKTFGKFEDDFLFLKNFLNIKTYNTSEIDLEKRYLTINPDYYFKESKKIKLDLFVLSVDFENSHFINLIRYIKTNNLKKLEYRKNYFKKFLYKNFPLREIKSFINKLLSFFGLEIFKFRIKWFWFPLIHFKENVFNGYKIGISDYNCNINKDKKFDLTFDFISLNLSDEKSKKIYKDTVYGKPSKVWENYYDLLFEKEHYQDYLYFEDANIINLGVDNGFELPFFLTNKINKIINVDPTGEEKLDLYVKSFVKNYKDKTLFDCNFLYDSKNVYTQTGENNIATNLFSIIKKYDCSNKMIIKSDIEGLELKMLEELDDLVKQYRPQLALSIYHIDQNLFPLNSQLVKIPNRLIEICKDYKFFLNHYTYNRRETVFYCIPKEFF